jgi:hypothetical protein
VVTAVVALVFSFVPRFPQPQSYHQFADHRSYMGIPNLGDVVSNLPFAVIGLSGVTFLLSSASATRFVDSRERWPYLIAFAGIFLTASGSAYYHFDPNNARLVWDRLPIMVAFTATAAAMIAERVEISAGLLSLPLLLTIGIASVLQWNASELRGAGDLRFYAAVQVCCTLVLLLVLIFPARYTRSGRSRAICTGENPGNSGRGRLSGGRRSRQWTHLETPCRRWRRILALADASEATSGFID